MKILITGSAGFIGYHFAKYFLKKNIKVIGIDNLNNYYSPRLKKIRLSILKKNKNFIFYKKDILDYKSLKQIFINHNITLIYHFAAQAGVRYSILHPRKYLDSNIKGFFNILEMCKDFRIKKLYYASSSSVYGDLKTFPLNENFYTKPKNFYSFSKKTNEDMAEIYSRLYKFKAIGLRFFTVFGEFGRPDMFIFKLLDCFYKKKVFKLNNYGNHTRDFTYINDAVDMVVKIKVKNISLHEVYNVCSNRPINLKKIIQIINNYSGLPKIKKVSFQQADSLKTHGDNFKILKNTKFKNFTNIILALKNTIHWYKNYYLKF
jgi:UDP-glucuronate 4-epimerase